MRVGRLLVLSAGRRRYVIEELVRAAGVDDELIVADNDAYTPGMVVPDTSPVVEPVETVDADEWLLSLCRDRGVDAVLSLHDYQAIRVSRLQDSLAAVGCRWIGPSASTAAELLSKKRLAGFLGRNAPELAIPTFSGSDALPDSVDEWVVKDDLGSGSSGLRVALTRAEAQRALADPLLVAQPSLVGEEWNLDFFVWGDGTARGASVKRKLRMRSGETDAAEVVPAVEAPFDVNSVLSAFAGISHVGNVDVDVFVTNSAVRVIDVNPRFGGGYAFSIHAGYRAAEATWQLVNRTGVTFPVEATKRFVGTKSIAVVPL